MPRCRSLAETKAEFDQINARSFEYKALKQEAEGDKGLYQELMRKIKEAGINSSFQNSSIRLADPARPDEKLGFCVAAFRSAKESLPVESHGIRQSAAPCSMAATILVGPGMDRILVKLTVDRFRCSCLC